MTLNIILRTVCGCERIIAIPHRDYPREYRVPYQRGPLWCLTMDMDSLGSKAHTDPGFGVRVFENTGTTGLYGYRVFLEKL